jgi:hypothetical protein
MVVPTALSASLIDRSPRHIFDYVIDIGIQKRIGEGCMTQAEIKAACDPLMLLVEEVVDLFRGRPLELAPGRHASCVGLANEPIFSAPHIDDMRVFTSLVSLTFRLGR